MSTLEERTKAYLDSIREEGGSCLIIALDPAGNAYMKMLTQSPDAAVNTLIHLKRAKKRLWHIVRGTYDLNEVSITHEED